MDFVTLPLPDGYLAVPPGKIASVVTFLEMAAPPAPRGRPAPEGLRLDRLGPGDAARYRAIYRVIGERWVWFSRLALSEAELSALLADERIEAYALASPDGDVGLLEIDRRDRDDEAELVYFGLAEPMIGKGAGRWMMDRAIAIAFARPIRRFWLHTCTLDHPGAIPFYRRSGFVPYRMAVEIADDPRAQGLVAPDIWPDMPPPSDR
ncbi:GNAT family N-acetyltransferase [Alsobacter sp. R-9]